MFSLSISVYFAIQTLQVYDEYVDPVPRFAQAVLFQPGELDLNVVRDSACPAEVMRMMSSDQQQRPPLPGRYFFA